MTDILHGTDAVAALPEGARDDRLLNEIADRNKCGERRCATLRAAMTEGGRFFPRECGMANQLFAKKSLKVLLDEMAGDHRLKRALGPVTLTALGIGAVIGAGIFVATGEAAHNTAGPALMVSYMAAGVTCIFAALCYAEFASMAPVAGSAYTYAYTTMGELFAWIIGWDLVLEYAVGAAT